ncbi:hypothetical protein Q8W71_00710 [Methylobacterium sp. NEAU 140]|uniref:hypothetical protein n=1 Tax=Methylobacterium sp. NEAU 140 TaxID=3064945 RepID=UPI002734E1E3|nr:hypothetical protein [Methylobacterium sp. NEAU 140]MDP4021130.1 hypothetical protein [Methylobacterium sp. NEAU 140]
MNDQTLIDTLADKLVAKGELVSYSSIQAALQTHNSKPGEDEGKGASYRDLKTLISNWRERRRYKGHLAALKMPEKMEKALAVFAARAMRAAEDLAAAKLEAAPATPDALAVMAQMERLVGRLEEQMAGLAAENRSLREEIAALRPAPAVVAEATAPGPPRPEEGGRKRGVPAATSRFFWDRVVRELCVEIRHKGPLTLEQMFAAIDADTRALAARSFQKIDAEKLEEKLDYRVKNPDHCLCRLPDNRYDLIKGKLPKRPAREQPAA